MSAIFENIPAYLSTHEKKIVLKDIEEGATFDRYDKPLFWLDNSMIYENVISQMIAAKGSKLYFYTRYNEEKHRNDIETDFLLSNESKTNFRVFPIEVKSSKNYTTTSLGRFKEMFGKIATQYIIHPKNFSIEGEVVKLPPYMTMMLKLLILSLTKGSAKAMVLVANFFEISCKCVFWC